MVAAGGEPVRLALETAIGPTSRSSSSATGCSGIRSITVPRVSPSSQASVGACGSTMDNPPGQNASIRSRAAFGTTETNPSTVRQEPTSTGAGIDWPRPLAASSDRTASELKASQPSPYTVSVGSTTSWPARTAAAAAASPVGRRSGSEQSKLVLTRTSLGGR